MIGAEHRHDVEERRGAVGADQLHTAIEAEIGQRRGKHRDIEQRQQIVGVDLHHRTREQFPDEQRDQAGRAAAEGEGDKRQAVDRRAASTTAPNRARRSTSATMKMRSPLLNSMFDSVVRSPCSRITSTPASDSSDRRRPAPRQPHAEQDQRPHRDDQRPGGLQQQRVERLGMLERPILQGVEGADAGDREHDHDAELAADRAPVAAPGVSRRTAE